MLRFTDVYQRDGGCRGVRGCMGVLKEAEKSALLKLKDAFVKNIPLIMGTEVAEVAKLQIHHIKCIYSRFQDNSFPVFPVYKYLY